MVSSKAYVRDTRGHLQGTMASNTIKTSMVLITAIAPFLSGVELSDIHDTETASYWEVPPMPVELHLTGKYHRCLSASLLQTSQCEYLEYERKKSRLQLKEAASFYNNLLVGKPLNDAVPSPPLQKISEIRWHLPPPTHIAPLPPPHPFPKSEKLRRRPTYCLSLLQAIGWFPHRSFHLPSVDEKHQDHWWAN